MSDKEKYEFDESFVDGAWEGMKDILDREMPQKKKKRRWLVLLLFFLSTCGGTSVFYFMDKDVNSGTLAENEIAINPNIKNDNADNISLNKLPQNEKENTIKTEEYIKGENEKESLVNEGGNEIKRNNKSIKNKTHKTKNKKQLIPINNYKSTSEVITNVTSYPIEIKKENASLKNKINKSVNAQLEEEQIQFENAKEVIEENTIVRKDYSDFTPQFVKTKLFDQIEYEEYKSDTDIPDPKFSKWSGYVEAGTMTKTFREIGAFARVGLTYHLREKWSLYTGLEYEFTPKQIGFFTNGLDLATADPLEDEESFAVSPSTGGFREFKYRDHRLRMPLGFIVRPGEKWSLRSSIFLSYRFERDRGVLELRNADSLGAPIEEEETNDSNQWLFPNWNVGLSTGISYDFHPKVSLFTAYDIAFKKQYQLHDDGRKVYMKGYKKMDAQLQLGIRYNF